MSSVVPLTNLWSMVPVDNIYRHMLTMCIQSSHIFLPLETEHQKLINKIRCSCDNLISYVVAESIDSRMAITSTTYSSTGISFHDTTRFSRIMNDSQSTVSGAATRSSYSQYVPRTYTDDEIQQWKLLMANIH
jgi:hypothetical protein